MKYHLETMLQDHGLTAGRMLIGLLFVFSAATIVMSGLDGLSGALAERGLPLPIILAWAAVVIELAGGAALMLGYRTREAALALLIFTGVTTLLYHLDLEDSHLFKNLAIIGGLLYIYVYGAGYGWSLDRQRAV